MADTEDAIPEGRAVPCNGPQMGLMWEAFGTKGIDEHQSKKARIARKFKCLMVVAKVFQPDGKGGMTQMDDPRRTKIFEDKTHMLTLNAEEAEHISDLLSKMKKQTNSDGTPVIDSTVADEVEDLETRVFPMWKAKVPESNGSAPELESHKTPLLESKVSAATAEGGTDA